MSRVGIGYFVTGTDTGVGKTTVTAGLVRALLRHGTHALAMKPAESGGDEDARLLRDAARSNLTLDALVPHVYALPVAPGVAARLEERPFSLPRVLAARDALSADVLFVEGAGGLLVPYADDLVGADIARALGYPLLVVARASLGTINHSVLTVLEARRRGLRVAGVILSRTTDEVGPDEPHNAAEISRLADVRVLGTVPHVAARTPDTLADAVESSLDVSAFCAPGL